MINIRPLQADDKEDVKSLIDSIMGREFSNERQAYAYQDLDDPIEHYSGDRDLFLVAEKDGRIVGTVAIKEDGPNSALLRRIFVHEDYRGKGYGEKLLSKAMEFCFDHNYKNVSFRGTDRMQNALKICIRNGFAQEDVADFDDFKLIVLRKELSGRGSDT